MSTNFIILGKKNSIVLPPAKEFVPFINLLKIRDLSNNPEDELSHEEIEWYKIASFNPTENSVSLK